MPNKSKRRKDKSGSQGLHHESPSDSGSLNRKAKSPVRSHVPSKPVSENSDQLVCSSNELLETNSEKSNVLTSHSSVCVQENASGNSRASSYVSSSLLKTLLDANVNENVKAKYKTQLNERTKCSSCTQPNILIRTDLEEFGDYILKLLEEIKKLELKIEDLSLKSEESKLPDEVLDAGQGNLNSVVYPDSANVCSMNTMEMEVEEAAAAVPVIEPCSSQNHQKDNKARKSSKKGNNWSDDRHETEPSASTLGNGSVEVGNDNALPGNSVDVSCWYQEEDIGVASGGQGWTAGDQDWSGSGGQEWSVDGGAGAGSQDDMKREATADEKHEGNPKEFRRGNYSRGSDPNEERGGWKQKEYRSRPNRSGDRGDPSEEKSGWRQKENRNRPNRSGDGGDPSEEKSVWRSKEYRNRPNRSGDRGGQRDAAGGRRGGDKFERTYKIVDEVFGDLFMAPKDHSLAHCVAEDMRMGSGIAVTFRQMFKSVETLVDQGRRSGQVAVLENEGRFIYYLVTKKVSNGKPRLSDLVSSVEEMKQHCVANRVTKIAMPRIGCGLDRLEWSTVKNVLEDKFADTDVHITVYNFQQGSGEPERPVPRSKLYVRQELMSLVYIEGGTGLVFLGTEDSHVDATIESLNTKYSFLHDYKMCNKRVGDVVRFEKKGEYLYGLIVKKTANDRFSYMTLNKCLCKFREMIWKDKYEYFGIEAFIVDDDDLTMEKIITLLKSVFFYKNLEAWICWPPNLEEIYKRFNHPSYTSSANVAGN